MSFWRILSSGMFSWSLSHCSLRFDVSGFCTACFMIVSQAFAKRLLKKMVLISHAKEDGQKQIKLWLQKCFLVETVFSSQYAYYIFTVVILNQSWICQPVYTHPSRQFLCECLCSLWTECDLLSVSCHMIGLFIQLFSLCHKESETE